MVCVGLRSADEQKNKAEENINTERIELSRAAREAETLVFNVVGHEELR